MRGGLRSAEGGGKEDGVMAVTPLRPFRGSRITSMYRGKERGSWRRCAVMHSYGSAFLPFCSRHPGGSSRALGFFFIFEKWILLFFSPTYLFICLFWSRSCLSEPSWALGGGGCASADKASGSRQLEISPG